jgi:hypothetical protein
VELMALTNGEIMILIVVTAVPIAALAFAMGAGNALREIGKGPFAVEYESDLGQKAPEPDSAAGRAAREDEIRQLLTAKAYRQSARGQEPLDVEEELGRLMAESSGGSLGDDAELREEVRQLVEARNARRARQGKEPLDVEDEIERQLRELESLGQ